MRALIKLIDLAAKIWKMKSIVINITDIQQEIPESLVQRRD